MQPKVAPRVEVEEEILDRYHLPIRFEIDFIFGRKHATEVRDMPRHGYEQNRRAAALYQRGNVDAFVWCEAGRVRDFCAGEMVAAFVLFDGRGKAAGIAEIVSALRWKLLHWRGGVMDDFWFWFFRPLAETLGALALLAAIFVLMIVWQIYRDWRAKK